MTEEVKRNMFALIAAILFLVAFILVCIGGVSWVTLLTLAGLFFLALSLSSYVRDRVGPRV